MKYKLKQNHNLGNYISSTHNDFFSKLNGDELTDLIIEMETYFITLRDRLNLPNKVTFGLELEFEDAIQYKVQDNLKKFNNTYYEYNARKRWNLVRDASVQTYKKRSLRGGEIVSPILKDNNQTWIDLNHICEMLIKLKATAENLAGGHIHFGSQIIGSEPKYWYNLFKLWSIYEKIIYRFSYGERVLPRKDIEMYATPIAPDLITIPSILDDYGENIDILMRCFPKAKTVGLSFKKVYSPNFRKNNTIEVRTPNMSFNPAILQNNVNFFAKLFLYCKSNQFDYDLIEYKIKSLSDIDMDFYYYSEIYLEEALELCDLIFDNNLDKINFLKQYLKGFKQRNNYSKDNPKITL